jgi:hypothetical protein
VDLRSQVIEEILNALKHVDCQAYPAQMERARDASSDRSSCHAARGRGHVFVADVDLVCESRQ